VNKLLILKLLAYVQIFITDIVTICMLLKGG